MGIISVFFTMVFLCLIPGGASQCNSPVSLERRNEGKVYLTQLCSCFAHLLKPIKKPPLTQFAVLSLEEIDFNTQETDISQKINNWLEQFYFEGKNWVASYIAYTEGWHLEEILLHELERLFNMFVQNNRKLPKDVYLYTYLIPCPGCATVIANVAQNIKGIAERYQSIININEIHSYLENMVFFVAWTNDENPNALTSAFGKTMSIFQKLCSENKEPMFHYIYLRRTMKDWSCYIATINQQRITLI